MHGGLRPLVNPPTLLKDVDLDATRDERHRLHEKVREQQFVQWAQRHGGVLVDVSELAHFLAGQQEEEPTVLSANPQ